MSDPTHSDLSPIMRLVVGVFICCYVGGMTLGALLLKATFNWELALVLLLPPILMLVLTSEWFREWLKDFADSHDFGPFRHYEKPKE